MPKKGSTQKWPSFICYAALTLVVLLIYSNVYSNSFLYDDVMLIVQNQLIRNWHLSILTTSIMDGVGISSSFYRPLQIFLYTVIFKIFGLSLFLFHFLNVILHTLNTCLVYKLGRKLGFQPLPVLLAALLWAVHPMNTEAIDWISAVPEPLYVFFGLTTFLILLPDFTFRKCLSVCPILLLALLSKETAVLLPLLALCTIFLTNKDRYHLKPYLRTLPLWILVGAYLVLRFIILPVSHTIPAQDDGVYSSHILNRFYTFLATLPSYLKLILWPRGLHTEYEFPVFVSFFDYQVILGFIILAAVVFLLFFGKSKKNLPLRWGCLWFLAAFSIYSGILLPVNGRFMEHWIYLPSIGLFLGGMESLFLYCERKNALIFRKAAIITTIPIVFILSFLTYQQNKLWRDEITMYSNSLTYSPNSIRMLNNLGIAYTEQNEFSLATAEFRKAIQLSDGSLLGHFNLALALELDPAGPATHEEAISELKHTLELDPNFYPACVSLAEIYKKEGKIKEANFYQRKADEQKEKGTLDTTPN